jgi:hypothetical protein
VFSKACVLIVLWLASMTWIGKCECINSSYNRLGLVWINCSYFRDLGSRQKEQLSLRVGARSTISKGPGQNVTKRCKQNEDRQKTNSILSFTNWFCSCIKIPFKQSLRKPEKTHLFIAYQWMGHNNIRGHNCLASDMNCCHMHLSVLVGGLCHWLCVPVLSTVSHCVCVPVNSVSLGVCSCPVNSVSLCVCSCQ